MKNVFYFIGKAFCSQDIQAFVILLLFSTLFRFKGTLQTGIIATLRSGLHELANIMFGIIQKPLQISA